MFKFKMRYDSRKTNHREPRDWIFGPITGQNAVPGQSHRFGHGDVNIRNYKCDETHRRTSQKCFGFLVIIL